jgi:VIT1/CCC1 family predicted Fe2+/Mn2+ transporter
VRVGRNTGRVDDASARYRRNLQDEVDTASLYAVMAEREENARLSALYRRHEATERRHAEFWAKRLEASGQPMRLLPSRRARILAWLARHFGPSLVLPSLAATEWNGQADYDHQAEADGTGMRGDERSHARLLRELSTQGGLEGGALARLEGRHRTVGGNALRAAVLGANDGLVSNLSLVMGVAGASLSSRSILVTGIAGLLAGSGSMAMGEWISVRSARELFERQIGEEREELEEVPDEEREELALIYQAKGLTSEQAAQLAERLIADRGTALDTLAREELGIDPEELGGSPVQAAGASFLLFCVGAVPPVLPFAFLGGLTAVAVSLALSGAVLFGIGAAITLLTGRSALHSGTRQLVIGFAAAGVTYGIGALVGAAV